MRALAILLGVSAAACFVPPTRSSLGGAATGHGTRYRVSIGAHSSAADSRDTAPVDLGAGWVTEGRVVGLAAGLLAFAPLRGWQRAGRIYLAIVLTLAGALFAKIFGAYSELADFLRLFSWPHGQLATFATLTLWIHEAWPVLALAWLIALFVWRRDEPIQ